MSKFVIILFSVIIFLAFHPKPTVQTGMQLTDATTKALIQTACSASTSPPLCYSILNSVANNPYLNPTDLTIVAVQAASKTTVATFDFINMTLTINAEIISDQELRKSLQICAAEYKNVLDLLDKTSTSLTQNVDTPQIPDYLTSCVASVAKCDASCVKFTNKAVQISTKNVDASKLIKNALNIYQVFAEYIANPSHDPNKVQFSSTGSGSATITHKPADNQAQNTNGQAPQSTNVPSTNVKFSMPFFSNMKSPSASSDSGGSASSPSERPSPSLIPGSNGMRFPFQSFGQFGLASAPKAEGSKEDTASPAPSTANKFSFPRLGGFKFP